MDWTKVTEELEKRRVAYRIKVSNDRKQEWAEVEKMLQENLNTKPLNTKPKGPATQALAKRRAKQNTQGLER